MMKNIIKRLGLLILTSFLFVSCLDLEEIPYTTISSKNFFKTKSDVYSVFIRPFEHATWTIGETHYYYLQELTADQLVIPKKDHHFYDGGQFNRLAEHTWTPEEGRFSGIFNAIYRGIHLTNSAKENLETLDLKALGVSEDEAKSLLCELKTMRVWYHMLAFDLFRNIPVLMTLKDLKKGEKQKTPKETFSILEKELKDAIKDLAVVGGGVNATRWTKAGAAALLARLYLNAEVYIGEDKYNDCAAICQKIIDGEYGAYAMTDSWQDDFAPDNQTKSSIIFAFSTNKAVSSIWHYKNYFKYFPRNEWKPYFKSENGDQCWYSITPSLDAQGNEYNFPNGLGTPVKNFKKYPDDLRLKKFKVTGESKWEGMFFYGYFDYEKEDGGRDTIKSDDGAYHIYRRDQIGPFKGLAPNEHLDASIKSSKLNGDQSSGWACFKYPIFPKDDPGEQEPDYALIRLAEVYYMLAECKLRKGGAGYAELLNKVRKRNYPAGSSSLYSSDADVTMDEMLAEWGREFITEGRRRTDLIRFDKFTKGRWWDKEIDPADKQEHLKVFPFGYRTLDTSTQMKQNPGYPKSAE